MGFTLEPNHYKLTFEDPDLAGFECTMRELTVAELLDITELLSDRSGDVRERSLRRSQMVADSLVSWNLEDAAGESLPMSAATLLAQPRRLSVAITAAWLREVVGLTNPPATQAPMSDSSDDGSASALASLPMLVDAGELDEQT